MLVEVEDEDEDEEGCFRRGLGGDTLLDFLLLFDVEEDEEDEEDDLLTVEYSGSSCVPGRKLFGHRAIGGGSFWVTVGTVSVTGSDLSSTMSTL